MDTGVSSDVTGPVCTVGAVRAPERFLLGRFRSGAPATHRVVTAPCRGVRVTQLLEKRMLLPAPLVSRSATTLLPPSIVRVLLPRSSAWSTLPTPPGEKTTV
jgi:hypothetical protein